MSLYIWLFIRLFVCFSIQTLPHSKHDHFQNNCAIVVNSCNCVYVQCNQSEKQPILEWIPFGSKHYSKHFGLRQKIPQLCVKYAELPHQTPPPKHPPPSILHPSSHVPVTWPEIGRTKESTCCGQMVHSSLLFPVCNTINSLKPPVRPNVLSLLSVSLYRLQISCSPLLLSYLERVEASDDPSVVHLAALGWVSELALLVGARARTPLELPAYFQCQPLCVTDVCYVHCHLKTPAEKSIPSGDLFENSSKSVQIRYL